MIKMKQFLQLAAATLSLSSISLATAQQPIHPRGPHEPTPPSIQQKKPGQSKQQVIQDELKFNQDQPEETNTPFITNNFFENDLREALQDIAQEAGVNVILGPSVQGFVSCDLKQVQLEEALRILLKGTGFDYVKDGRNYIICSMSPGTPSYWLLAENEVVTLSYQKVETIVNLLPNRYKPYVRSDKTSSSLTISAPQSIKKEIIQYIEFLDLKPKQVLLQAKIVVLERGDLLDIGVQWDFPTSQFGGFTNNTKNGGSNNGWGLQVGYTPNMEFTQALMATLNLLESNDQATVVATPQVMAIDKKEAEISVINEEYFDVLTNGYYTKSELEKITSGTMLNITPTINDNDEIELSIKAEVSGVVARGENALPVVTRRKTFSTVRLSNGGTAAVAGLMDSKSRERNEDVPWFASIPLLGGLFHNENSYHTDRQVAIFITAVIVGTEKNNRVVGINEKRQTYPQAGDQFTDQLRGLLNKTGKERR